MDGQPLHANGIRLCRRYLIIAGVAISVIGVMTALWLSRMIREGDYARSIQCASNVKQIALACALYSEKHDGKLPHNLDELQEVIQPTRIFICPSAKDQAHNSYAFTGATNRWGVGADTVILREIEANHYGGRFVLYDDGRVELRRDSR
jgi:hypothetical protein